MDSDNPQTMLSHGIPQLACGALAGHALWQGEIHLTGDVVVPAGITLDIAPGTVIRAHRDAIWNGEVRRRIESKNCHSTGENSRRIIVYGKLRISGDSQSPVQILSGPGRNKNVTLAFLHFSRGLIQWLRVDAQAGAPIALWDRARVHFTECQFDRNHHALHVAGLSRATLMDCVFSNGDTAISLGEFGRVAVLQGSFIANRRAVVLEGRSRGQWDQCAFSENRDVALLAEGHARAAVDRCSFEKNPQHALWLRERANARLAKNRFLHNGLACMMESNSKGCFVEEKWGPNQRAVHINHNARAHFERCSLFGHKEGASVHGKARSLWIDCQFFSNLRGVGCFGRSMATLLRCRLNHQSQTALEFGQSSRGRFVDCRLERNRIGLLGCDEARLTADRCDWDAHVTAAARLFRRSRLTSRNSRYIGSPIGVETMDESSVISRGDQWREQTDHGLLMRHAGRCDVRGARFIKNGVSGAQGLDQSRLLIKKSQFFSNQGGIGVQDRASLRAVGNLFCLQKGEAIYGGERTTVQLIKNRFIHNRRGWNCEKHTLQTVKGNTCQKSECVERVENIILTSPASGREGG